MAITFDGVNKIISFNSSTTAVDGIEIYSRWKDWIKLSDNTKFLPAFSDSVGGEALGGGVTTGQYFFLQNGWKIKPFEENHRLLITGNIFPIPDTADVFQATDGNYNVVIEMRNSSLTQGFSGLGGSNEVKVVTLENKLRGTITRKALKGTLKTRVLVGQLQKHKLTGVLTGAR